jgi:hypothetical protein
LGWFSGLGYGPLQAERTIPSNLDAQARNELLNAIKNMNVNLAQAYAEKQKTADMVGTTAMNIANAMINLRRGNFRGAANALGVPPPRRGQSRFSREYAKRGADAVAGGWLSLQYGWKPAMADVFGACETLANAGREPLKITTTTKKRVITPMDFFESSKSQDKVTTRRIIGQRVTTAKYGVTYQRDPHPLTSMKEVGITNPAVLAWELIPYSFVVDWFLPIGDFISAWDATIGLNFVSGYRTLFSKSVSNYRTQSYGRFSSYVDSDFQQSSFKAVFCKRTPLTGFPAAALPVFKNPVSLDHMANGLALLVKSFRK